jgi:hypothetical protein
MVSCHGCSSGVWYQSLCPSERPSWLLLQGCSCGRGQTPEQYVPGPGAAPAESNFILPDPALVPANAPSILATVSSLNEFDDGWKLRASFSSNQAQHIGKTSLYLMVWVPSVMKDGIVRVVFRSDQLLF